VICPIGSFALWTIACLRQLRAGIKALYLRLQVADTSPLKGCFAGNSEMSPTPDESEHA